MPDQPLQPRTKVQPCQRAESAGPAPTSARALRPRHEGRLHPPLFEPTRRPPAVHATRRSFAPTSPASSCREALGGDVQDFSLHRPADSAPSATLPDAVRAGAIDEDNQITQLGWILSAPHRPRSADDRRGQQEDCLREVLIIASALRCRSRARRWTSRSSPTPPTRSGAMRAGLLMLHQALGVVPRAGAEGLLEQVRRTASNFLSFVRMRECRHPPPVAGDPRGARPERTHAAAPPTKARPPPHRPHHAGAGKSQEEAFRSPATACEPARR